MRVTLLVAGLVAVAAAVLLGGGDATVAGRADGDSVIQQYPAGERDGLGDFEGTLLDGQPFASADLRGRVVVYNVWGSWCVPCRVEAPALADVASENDDVRFVGINVRDSLGAAQAFERRQAVPYPSLRSEDSDRALLAFGGALSAAGVPATVVVDHSGGIAARVLGPTSRSTLRALIDDVRTETATAETPTRP